MAFAAARKVAAMGCRARNSAGHWQLLGRRMGAGMVWIGWR